MDTSPLLSREGGDLTWAVGACLWPGGRVCLHGSPFPVSPYFHFTAVPLFSCDRVTLSQGGAHPPLALGFLLPLLAVLTPGPQVFTGSVALSLWVHSRMG